MASPSPAPHSLHIPGLGDGPEGKAGRKREEGTEKGERRKMGGRGEEERRGVRRRGREEEGREEEEREEGSERRALLPCTPHPCPQPLPRTVPSCAPCPATGRLAGGAAPSPPPRPFLNLTPCAMGEGGPVCSGHGGPGAWAPPLRGASGSLGNRAQSSSFLLSLADLWQ